MRAYVRDTMGEETMDLAADHAVEAILRDELAREARALVAVVPVLRHLLGTSNQAAEQQQQALDGISAAVEQLSATIQEVAGNTRNAAEQTRQAQALSDDGQRQVGHAHQSIAALAATGTAVLVVLATRLGDPWKIVSFSIYGAMLVLLYAASTAYHSVRARRPKAVLQKIDHCSIYLLIAGSYTPFALVSLRGAWGWSLLGVVWGLALLGIAQEIWWARGARVLSLVIYVLMGWLALVAVVPLWQALTPAGFAWLLAGGTDVALWVNKQFRSLGDILYVGRVRELQQITPWGADPAQPDGLEIGAGVSLEEAWSTLSRHVPALREIWLRFASPPVRHAGTLGGNVANGSPIGDGAPILLALGATLVLRQGERTRELPLSEFYLGYMHNALQPGEFVQALRVPLPRAARGEALRAYKVSKRRDSDISALCAGLMIRLEGGRVKEARLGWGGMAATARRAALTEAALIGQPWSEATLQAAQAALAQDFAPMTDLRATRDYRHTVAANLLKRFWMETRPDAPLPSTQTQIWPAPV